MLRLARPLELPIPPGGRGAVPRIGLAGAGRLHVQPERVGGRTAGEVRRQRLGLAQPRRLPGLHPALDGHPGPAAAAQEPGSMA